MEGLRLKYTNMEQQSNHRNHQTQGLSSRSLVVRRGVPFKVTLFFEGRGYDSQVDTLTFAAFLDRSYVAFPASFAMHNPQSGWNAQILQGDVYSKSLSVQISAPPSASIGLYTLHFKVQSQYQTRNYIIGDFILLFNPWCRGDSVFLPGENQREEYVKNDFGFIYTGTPQNMESRPWAFGQFEEGILEICLNLLQISPQHGRNSGRDYFSRRDPVYISRVVCAMINCEDDRGVLKGNWSGDYSSGVNPSDWTGSAEILQQWARSKFSPVRYGQCWVYAAVMCTVMRVLGIPTRVVTNFNSAHDTNANMIIEEYYSDRGEKLNISADSIWNFHVWVECWMARPDLGYGCDGWQVLDPTPQERSEGVFCCGPSPVTAIKRGCVNLLYDVPFVFAEVNADVHTIIVRNNQEISRSVDRGRIGSLICTKSIGLNTYENITTAYKIPKAGTSYRTTNGGGLGGREDFRLPSGRKSVEVSLLMRKPPIMGENIEFTVNITNKSNFAKVLRECVNGQAKEYNSSALKAFWEAYNVIKIGPFEVKTINHQIPYSLYGKELVGHNLMNLAVVIEDEETKECVLASEEINISSPTISIELANEHNIVQNEEQTAIIVFTNTLPVPVSDGTLTVEGVGLIEGKLQFELPVLQAGEKVERAVRFTPRTLGSKMLLAHLITRSNIYVSGFKTVYVKAE
ncbi:transglutaminase 5, like [Lepisosteus oculatus]|uniref:transglutaminase 5, like n=1 Tax=Lepisosteus oculatus TaxID=7918 RepID=UPI00073FD2F0|nr:PREDICTED: protein-glutamine gamma-glutamyltransferase 2-like [Lepisosteus oculatus]